MLDLGLQERFELAEAHCGYFPVIILVASSMLSVGELHSLPITRIADALAVYPLLSAVVNNRLTGKPVFSRGRSLSPSMVMDGDVSTAVRPSDVIEREEVQAQLTIDLENGPLWRVALYDNPAAASNRSFVALTISHIICDGSGALKLISDLVREVEQENTGIKPLAMQDFPPKAENTLDMWPNPAFAVKTIAKTFASMPVPRFLQHTFGGSRTWLTPEQILKSPTECPIKRIVLGREDLRTKYCPVIDVQGLKTFGKITGSGSVQAILYAAAVVALGTAIQGFSVRYITSETLMALRASNSGHPEVTGNYTALGEFETNVGKFEQVKYRLWELVNEYYCYIHSSAGRRDARNRAGMLALVPDLPSLYLERIFGIRKSPAQKEGRFKVTPALSGFEALLMQNQARVNGPEGPLSSPYRNSIAISNLGVLPSDHLDDPEKSHLRGLWFAQTPMP